MVTAIRLAMTPVRVAKSPWPRILLGLLAVVSGSAGLAARRALSVERNMVEAAASAIAAEKLKSHIDVLADDTFEGREAGSRGGRAAAGYLVKQFEEYGLKPSGDRGSYDQSFGASYHNLLGLLEGSDPNLRDQVIVVGAHYDHVGYGSRGNSYGPFGYIHNGADDNASGTACLLALVDACSRLPEPPKRSILFALWDGEEKGLLGSQHWLTAPTIPLGRVAFAINVDMIGRLRNDRVEVYGIRTSHGLRQLLGQANQVEQLDLDFSWELKANSDHHPFFARGIPVLMFHTGLHEDYHRPSDDVHKIDVDGVQRVTRLAFRTVCELSEEPTARHFRATSRAETPAHRDQVEPIMAPPSPRMGARWLPVEDGAGVRVTGLVRGSAAERGGLRVGDILERFQDEPITDADRLRLQVLAAPSPLKLSVRRAGAAEVEELSLPIDGHPMRIGLSWREDEAEPESVLVTMIVPASAAQQAGVQPRDRVYEVNGQRVRNSEHFQDLLTTQPGPLDLLVDRRGRRLTLRLPILPK